MIDLKFVVLKKLVNLKQNKVIFILMQEHCTSKAKLRMHDDENTFW